MKNDIPWTHIGDSLCFKRQAYLWGDIPNGVIIELELVNFFKSEIRRSYKGGAYQDFAAYAINDIDCLGVEKGVVFGIGIPFKTFFKAMDRCNNPIKCHISREIGRDNIYLKFKKKSACSMDILDIDIRKEDDVMTKKASEYIYCKDEKDRWK